VPLLLPRTDAAVTDDAFIRAVIANPADDAPRLIYADWLEENGRPERAEFIRLQCLGVRLSPGSERTNVRDRSRLLLKQHGRQWVAPLSRWLRRGTFRRGFLEDVTVPAGAYLDHAPDIICLTPVRRFRVDLTGFRAGHDIARWELQSVSYENICIPLGRRRDRLILAAETVEDCDQVQMLRFILNEELEFVEAPREQIVAALDFHFREGIWPGPPPEPYVVRPDDPPVVLAVEMILEEAISQRATELRLEARADEILVTHRVAGRWVSRDSLPLRLFEFITARIRQLMETDTEFNEGFRFGYDSSDYEIGVTFGVAPEGRWVLLAPRLPAP
jgi:uncharacterized protein (TIGR02996 family)